ncbi:MAG: DUF4834 family protein [Daejeonella sp.]
MVLLKFLFITICVLWLLKMVARLLLPIFFQKLMTKAQNQANQRYQQQHQQSPDGRIRVEYMPPKEKSRGDNVGDFVEYEEVK